MNHLFIRFIRVIRGSIVFRRERGDDFFEARIAAERVPEGEQLKHTVARSYGSSVCRRCGGQLLQG
jgi:hypothetical protein